MATETGWDAPPYEMNRVMRIPQAIPELGVEAGDGGVIDFAHERPDGTILLNVEIPKNGGYSVGSATILVLADGSLQFVSYTRLNV